jgi:hypothetical protein
VIATVGTLIAVGSTTAFATAIVCIRTPDAIAIAADSLGTFTGGETRPVCKIQRAGRFFFAVEGLAEDPGRGFSPRSEINRALATDSIQTVDSVARIVAAALQQDFGRELSALAAQAPDDLRRALASPPGVLLVGVDAGTPTAVAFHLQTTPKTSWPGAITTEWRRCPGVDCPQGHFTFFLGPHGGIDAYIAEHGSALAMLPEEAARFMVDLEIQRRTRDVGGPIDVLTVTSRGARWITVKPQCAISVAETAK